MPQPRVIDLGSMAAAAFLACMLLLGTAATLSRRTRNGIGSVCRWGLAILFAAAMAADAWMPGPHRPWFLYHIRLAIQMLFAVWFLHAVPRMQAGRR